MPWVDDIEVQSRVAADLQKHDPNDLRVDQDTFLMATDSAKQEIIGKLLGRGYTADQVEGWDRLTEFHLSLSKFWVYTLGGVPHGYSDIHIKTLDRRKDLDTVAVFVGGELVNPSRAASTDPGGAVGYGRINAVSDPSLCGW